MEQALTVAEVAARLRINPKTVYRMLQTGRLRGVRAGRLWRVPLESLDLARDRRRHPGTRGCGDGTALKQRLHRLVDELPVRELELVERFVEQLTTDPFLRVLAQAPEDDEPTTPEEDEGAEEAWQEYLRGCARPWEEVRQELARE